MQLVFHGSSESLQALQDELMQYPVDGSFLDEVKLISSMPLAAWQVEWAVRFQLLADAFAARLEIVEVGGENWNQEWERSFTPYEIENFCRIRASFHEVKPGFAYQLVIDPKMAFGTGHHQTTALMIEIMRDLDLVDRVVLDYGAGTGILGILAAKMGAAQVWCVENDPVACENLRENVKSNKVAKQVVVLQNSAPLPLPQRVDVIFINITRNAIKKHLPVLLKELPETQHVLISGFVQDDHVHLMDWLHKHQLLVEEVKLKDGWSAMKLILGQ